MLDLGLDLNVWPWVWLGVAIFFAVIELTVLAGSFVLLPFAISAMLAALLGFYDVAIEIQWLVFLGGGGLIWLLLFRYAKRFAGENELQPGVGADRLVGISGIVTVAIDPDDTERRGRVSAQGDVWGALSATGQPIAVGTRVRLIEVNGTKVMVEPVDDQATPAPETPPAPPTGPPSTEPPPTSSSPPPSPPAPPPPPPTPPA